MKYRTRLRTSDFLPIQRMHVGSKGHTHTMDVLAAIQNEDDEDIVRLALSGWSHESIAAEFGVHQTTISRRLRKIFSNAA